MTPTGSLPNVFHFKEFLWPFLQSFHAHPLLCRSFIFSSENSLELKKWLLSQEILLRYKPLKSTISLHFFHIPWENAGSLPRTLAHKKKKKTKKLSSLHYWNTVTGYWIHKGVAVSCQWEQTVHLLEHTNQFLPGNHQFPPELNHKMKSMDTKKKKKSLKWNFKTPHLNYMVWHVIFIT